MLRAELFEGDATPVKGGYDVGSMPSRHFSALERKFLPLGPELFGLKAKDVWQYDPKTSPVNRNTSPLGPKMIRKRPNATGQEENQVVFISRERGERQETDLPNGRNMDFGARFQHALRMLPVKERERVLGKTDKILRGYVDDRVSLGIVLALARATNVPVNWIIFGDKGVGDPSPIEDNFSPVPKLEIRASAGGGAIAAYGDDEFAASDIVAFRSDWLRKLGINPKYARGLFAHGDSMWPTIADGDLLLVDESIQSVVGDGIYVVVYQGMVLVKRLQLKRDGTLVLKSDNERYEPEIVPAHEVSEIRIAARVRWYGRAI